MIHKTATKMPAVFVLLFGFNCTPMQPERSISTQIIIDSSIHHQSIVGFGAAMTGSTAWLLMNQMSPTQRMALLRQLFGTTGISLSALRLPMGSSDFSLEAYSYENIPGYFSIEKDKIYIIPALLEALKINPNLSIIASPWSAPAWMKTSNSLNGGALIDSPEIHKAYASYFRKFVQAYQKAGIPIFAVTLQNEPQHDTTDMPSMTLTPAVEQSLAIAIGQEFKQAGLQTKIIGWDHNWDNTAFATEILSGVVATEYIEGIAFHCYAGDVSAQSVVQRTFPSKNIYFTECSSGSWSGGFASDLMWDAKNLIIGATRNWARTVLKWNLALDNQHGPKLPGGCSNCRGIVTIGETGQVIFNEDYYALAHLSQFVSPGAWRIASSHPNSVAFQNPNQDIVILLSNPDPKASYTYQIIGPNLDLNVNLPASSLATLAWSSSGKPVQLWLTSGDKENLLWRVI